VPDWFSCENQWVDTAAAALVAEMNSVQEIRVEATKLPLAAAAEQ
jgi:hypothetical protein